MKKIYLSFGVNYHVFQSSFFFFFSSFFLLFLVANLNVLAQQTGDMRGRHNVTGGSITGTTFFEVYDASTGRWSGTSSNPSNLTAGQTFTVRDGVTQTCNGTLTFACKMVIGEGNAAAGVATINGSGVVTGITVTDPGKLIVNPFITFVGSSTTLATASVSSFKISGYEITNTGSGYTTANVRIGNVWSATTAYTLNTQVNSGGNLYTCTTAGTSGTISPTGTGSGITDGTAVWSYAGIAATATATTGTNTITNATGAITALTITAEGSGYISMPGITITGDGTSATANARLGVLSVSITNGGAGYTTAPMVYFGSVFQVGNNTTTRTVNMNGGLEFKKGAGLFTGGVNEILNISGDLTVASPVFAYTPQTTSNVSTAINFTKSGTSIIDGQGSITFRNTSVSANTILKVNATAKFAGTVSLNSTGTIDATQGIIEYITYTQTPVAQTIANNTFVSSKIKALTINNTSGVTINQAIEIDSLLKVSTGTFTVGANLKINDNASVNIGATGILNITTGATNFNSRPVLLESNVSGTASIATIAGTLSNANNVTIQKFIAGGGSSSIAGPANSKRGFRFLSHPFSTSVSLASLMVDGGVDITGVGGVVNRFSVNTGSNNPSAFRFVNADITENTVNGIANGWVAYTSGIDSGTNGTSLSANRIEQYKGLRILYRGSKGTGLDGNNYTVGNASIGFTGNLNIGTQIIPLQYNTTASSGWNLVGNPYPSNVNMALLDATRRTNIEGSGFYVWNPSAATRGAYETVAWESAYILPSYASFFVQTNATGASLEFRETDKVSTAATQALFSQHNKSIQIQLNSGSIVWDALHVRLNAAAADAKEQLDAVKFANPDIDWYTISSDAHKLAIDSRKLNSNLRIPVGIKCNTPLQLTATITNLPENDGIHSFYLKDKYLDKLIPLEKGTEYAFSVTVDNESKGDNRFELLVEATSRSAVNAPVDGLNDLWFKLKTNVISNSFDVIANNPSTQNFVVKVFNQSGQFVSQHYYSQTGNSQFSIPANQLPSGMYFLEVRNGNYNTILKAVKP